MHDIKLPSITPPLRASVPAPPGPPPSSAGAPELALERLPSLAAGVPPPGLRALRRPEGGGATPSCPGTLLSVSSPPAIRRLEGEGATCVASSGGVYRATSLISIDRGTSLTRTSSASHLPEVQPAAWASTLDTLRSSRTAAEAAELRRALRSLSPEGVTYLWREVTPHHPLHPSDI